jgi:hypothetical protein
MVAIVANAIAKRYGAKTGTRTCHVFATPRSCWTRSATVGANVNVTLGIEAQMLARRLDLEQRAHRAP